MRSRRTRRNVIAWRVYGLPEVMSEYVYRLADICKRRGKRDDVTFGRSDAQFVSPIARCNVPRCTRVAMIYLRSDASADDQLGSSTILVIMIDW